MKRWLIILLVVVVGLNIVLFWFYKQAGLKKQNQVTQPVAQSPATQYPYFPANTETFLDTEKTWQSASFQPIFKELVEAGANKWYIVVNYSASVGGALEEGKIFLGVQIPYIDKFNNKTIVDSVKLKDELKAGDQFGITYLSKIPADFSLKMPYCQGYTSLPVECLLAYFKQQSDKNGEKVFYPFTVYRILKQ